MFFGHCSEAATLGRLAKAGLTVRRSSIDRQDNEDAAFLWVEALKER